MFIFRHGAHNWEGPGALTAITALFSLSKLVQEYSWISQKIDTNRVVYAGKIETTINIHVHVFELKHLNLGHGDLLKTLCLICNTP